MTALAQVATLDCARPCPICDRHLELIGIKTVPWAPHTSGERLLFRCANCGVSRTEWNTLPIVAGPEIVPETGAGLVNFALLPHLLVKPDRSADGAS
jgi:hypothetical protein